MILQKLKTNKNIIALGAGNAFSYIFPSFFLDKYTIICLFNKKDTKVIKKEKKIFSVEEYIPNITVPRVNQKELLKLDIVNRYILNNKNPSIFVRKTTPGTQNFVNDNNLELLSNPRSIRDPFENKLFFRNALISLGLKHIEGETFLFSKLNYEIIKKMHKKYGPKIVLQVSELTHGGGVGTAYIENEDDFIKFREKMIKIKNGEVKRNIENVIVTKFIKGIQASILGCVTTNEIIVGSLQTQLQDLKDVVNPEKGSGVYCGHDWGYLPYNNEVIKKTTDLVKIFGNYMKSFGYKGIFGLDIIIDESKVYPVECNPRYTDALPVVSFLELEKGIIPLEYYHFAEFLGINISLPLDINSNKAKMGYMASQIILSSRSNNFVINKNEIEAGIYKYLNGKLVFLNESFDLRDINNNLEFLITDGVPNINTKFKPRSRILRVIFKKSILEREGKLKKEVSDVIEAIYKKLNLIEVI